MFAVAGAACAAGPIVIHLLNRRRYDVVHWGAMQFLEISEATYLRWRNQYGGMKSEEAKRLKLLEEENKRLKELVAELTLDNRMLKHVAEKNW